MGCCGHSFAICETNLWSAFCVARLELGLLWFGLGSAGSSRGLAVLCEAVMASNVSVFSLFCSCQPKAECRKETRAGTYAGHTRNIQVDETFSTTNYKTPTKPNILCQSAKQHPTSSQARQGALTLLVVKLRFSLLVVKLRFSASRGGGLRYKEIAVEEQSQQDPEQLRRRQVVGRPHREPCEFGIAIRFEPQQTSDLPARAMCSTPAATELVGFGSHPVQMLQPCTLDDPALSAHVHLARTRQPESKDLLCLRAALRRSGAIARKSRWHEMHRLDKLAHQHGQSQPDLVQRSCQIRHLEHRRLRKQVVALDKHHRLRLRHGPQHVGRDLGNAHRKRCIGRAHRNAKRAKVDADLVAKVQREPALVRVVSPLEPRSASGCLRTATPSAEKHSRWKYLSLPALNVAALTGVAGVAGVAGVDTLDAAGDASSPIKGCSDSSPASSSADEVAFISSPSSPASTLSASSDAPLRIESAVTASEGWPARDDRAEIATGGHGAAVGLALFEALEARLFAAAVGVLAADDPGALVLGVGVLLVQPAEPAATTFAQTAASRRTRPAAARRRASLRAPRTRTHAAAARHPARGGSD
ncbi:hypothetical protein L1887_57713 [Cichorium endivia]|nr:hypothetical protein L1887_57713 [Cichorium endivia]